MGIQVSILLRHDAEPFNVDARDASAECWPNPEFCNIIEEQNIEPGDIHECKAKRLKQ